MSITALLFDGRARVCFQELKARTLNAIEEFSLLFDYQHRASSVIGNPGANASKTVVSAA